MSVVTKTNYELIQALTLAFPPTGIVAWYFSDVYIHMQTIFLRTRDVSAGEFFLQLYGSPAEAASFEFRCLIQAVSGIPHVILACILLICQTTSHPVLLVSIFSSLLLISVECLTIYESSKIFGYQFHVFLLRSLAVPDIPSKNNLPGLGPFRTSKNMNYANVVLNETTAKALSIYGLKLDTIVLSLHSLRRLSALAVSDLFLKLCVGNTDIIVTNVGSEYEAQHKFEIWVEEEFLSKDKFLSSGDSLWKWFDHEKWRFWLRKRIEANLKQDWSKIDRNDISLIDWENILLKDKGCKDLIFPRVNFLGVLIDNWLLACLPNYKAAFARTLKRHNRLEDWELSIDRMLHIYEWHSVPSCLYGIEVSGETPLSHILRALYQVILEPDTEELSEKLIRWLERLVKILKNRGTVEADGGMFILRLHEIAQEDRKIASRIVDAIDGLKFTSCCYREFALDMVPELSDDWSRILDHVVENKIFDYGNFLSKLLQMRSPRFSTIVHCLQMMSIARVEMQEVPWLDSLFGSALLESTTPVHSSLLKQIQAVKRLNAAGHSLAQLSNACSNFRSLVHLNLEENNLMELPEEFKELTKLEDLLLSKNNFRTIPEVIFSLTSLKKLSFRQNQLRLPLDKRLGQLEVKSLDLSYNWLTNVDAIMGLTKLEKLNMERNKIDKFPGIQTPNLRELNLSMNHLAYLPFSLGVSQTLRVLKVKSNKFEDFPDVIHQFSRLELLDLSSNKLESIPVISLRSLRALYLQENPIKECYEDFSRHRYLSTLDLGDFDFNETRKPSRKNLQRDLKRNPRNYHLHQHKGSDNWSDI